MYPSHEEAPGPREVPWLNGRPAAGIRIVLADPQGQLMEEIADPAMTRRQVALTYRLAAAEPGRVDWPAVNRAIVARWSASALDWIKREAWRRS